MRKLLCGFLLLNSLLRLEAEAEWLTDMPTALKKAQEGDKAVLVDFTGSDWCGWCIKLHKEVFDQPEFAEFAKENLVLLELDFPRRKEQPAELKAKNQKLMEEFGVKGFPTIFLLDKTGKKIAQGGYAPGGAIKYIAILSNVKGLNWRGKMVERAKAEQPTTLSEDSAAQSAASIPYDDLKLKGIIGDGAKKIALVNSQTFSAGEITSVKLGGRPVEIRCLEIREGSVVLQVPGRSDPLELKLPETKP